MFSCFDHMHTFAYMLSKSPLFPPYHFPLCSFSPSCTLLPDLICSAFHLSRGLWVQRQRETRGRGAGGVATRGNKEREEARIALSEMIGCIYTHRGHCSVEAPVISLGSVWPSFFLLLLPSPLLLDFLQQPSGDFHPPQGRWLRGTRLDFPWQAVCSNEQWPASVCLHVLAKYESLRSQTPVKNREG